MDTRLNILSPLVTVPTAHRAAAPTAAPPSSAPTESYAGSVAARPVLKGAPATAAPAAAKATHRARAVLLGTLALAGVFGGFVAAQAQLIPPPQIGTTQTGGTGSQVLTYSNPSRPLPADSSVDTNTWLTQSRAAFQAVKSGDAGAFLQQASGGGVWVRGLQGAPKTATGMVYMTHAEISRDLQQKGPLFREVFQNQSRRVDGKVQGGFPNQRAGNHSNARLVLSPDSQGHVQTILLD